MNVKEPVSLKLVGNNIDIGMINVLEDLLEDARQGRLVEFELVGRYCEGRSLKASGGDRGDPNAMFGLLTASALDYREKHM